MLPIVPANSRGGSRAARRGLDLLVVDEQHERRHRDARLRRASAHSELVAEEARL